MTAGIKAIEYYLPENILSNSELSSVFPEWTSDKIFEKTGIKKRHICSENECASDLAVKAAEKLLSSGVIGKSDIDFLMLATQTPDYILPTTACIIQDRLGLPKTCGAFDFNLGCSAFVYGLAVSKGLLSAGIAGNILFITSETYSKHINPADKGTRTIFGDGAAAVLVSEGGHTLGEFDLCTDGSGFDKLIIPAGGARKAGLKDDLYMSGTDIFNFTISAVPESVVSALRKNGLNICDIDVFVFHQANKFMLDYLRKKIGIPEEKFIIDMENTGNTVSPTIPIALKRSVEKGRIKKGDKVLISGFGVGLSWGSAVIEW